MAKPDSVLNEINQSLQDGWQAKLNKDGRIYYLDHNSRISQWIPPPTCWYPKSNGLPYGWEEAVDKTGKHYYINHVTCATTREDPYDVEDIPPVEREVTLLRDRMLGFGFIAGSEKPVVVRSVTEDGPSVGKLLPGDKILRLNGEDVKTKDGPYIIERIRQSSETIRLTVIQPYIDKTGLKSSFLSANKKQKLKSKPSKVRFADNIKVAAVDSGKSSPSLVYLPSVLKVYLENGQTKSFKYDNKTAVKDVLRNLKEKLTLRCMEHFSLVVQNMKQSECSSKFTILQEDETLTQIASRPGSEHWKCLLRVAFVPQDAYDLLSKDFKAFDYFYMQVYRLQTRNAVVYQMVTMSFRQCCNDVINERFIDNLDNDKAVRLAALHIQQHFLGSKQSAKVSLKVLEKEDGVERFLPASVAKQMKSKELKRLISQHIKQSQYLCAPGQKYLTELQAKLHYLKIVCDLRSFGGKYFTGTMVTSVDDYNCTVLVGPKCGISEVISLQDNVMSQLADFNQLTDIQLSPMLMSGDCLQVELYVNNETPIILLLTHDDAYDMVTLINGYYRLFVDSNKSLLPLNYSHSQEAAPSYHGIHRVQAAEWNYPMDLASEVVPALDSEGEWTELASQIGDGGYIIDLSVGPPAYEEDVAYINGLKSQGRFHPAEASGGQPDGSTMAFTVHEEAGGGYDYTIHRNTNNSSLDSSTMTRSDTSTVSTTWSSDNSSDLTNLADKIEDMFNTHTPESESWIPRESRQEMTIDGADESKVFSEITENLNKVPRRKSPTKHFDMSDTVAMSLPVDEETTDGPVKLLHYAMIYNDDSLIPVREICQPSLKGYSDMEETSSSSLPLEAENDKFHRKLEVQDSVVIAHKQKVISEDESSGRDVSEGPKVRDSKMESFRHLSSFPSSSVDSDIVDLTLDSLANTTVGENSSTRPSEPPGLILGNLDNVTDDRKVTDNINSAVPVSIIDLPSPDQDEEEEEDEKEETSVQGDGIQLAVLDAINVSTVQREQLVARSINRDPECESDSGNETISSEIIDNGVSDESGASHSPSDYFSLISGQRAISKTVDRDPTPTPEHSEDTPDQDPSPNLCFGSDTDSVSTLYGSSPNLSAIEGFEKASESPEKDTESTKDALDDLIAVLLNNPPPLNAEIDVDEELLNAIIPPPSVSDFNIGLIESLIVPPLPPKFPAVSPQISQPGSPAKLFSSDDNVHGTTAEVSLGGEKLPNGEEAALEVPLHERDSDCQRSGSVSPVTGSPVKSTYESMERKSLSHLEACPGFLNKIQALSSTGKPLYNCTKEDIGPRKISSSVMSSSQDGGFGQLGPRELEQAVMIVDTLGVADTEEVLTVDKKTLHREKIIAENGPLEEAEVSFRIKSSLKDVQDSENCDGDEKCSVEIPKSPADPVSYSSCRAVKSIPTKSAPVIPPKPTRPKAARQESNDSLNGGDFDTSGPLEKTEMKVSPKAPEPPPRKRYSPGIAKKAYSTEVRNGSESRAESHSVEKPSLKINPEYGEYFRQIEDTSTVKMSSSFTPKSLPQQKVSPLSGTRCLHQNLNDKEDLNLVLSSVKNGERNGKTPLSPRLSENLELRNVGEGCRPVRSNTFSSGSTHDFNKAKRQTPSIPPKPNKLKKSTPSEEIPLSPKEKKSFRTGSVSHVSSIAKLFSPKRNFSFLHGTNPFSKTDRSDDNVISSSPPKEKKEFKRPRPLRAFRSLSRKDSYDVSMFDRSSDESLSLRSVGGLQRSESLNFSDSTDENEETSGSLISHRVSLFEMKSMSVEDTSKKSHPPLGQSQSLGRATGRPVSYPSSPPHKYPGQGSVYASLPKRPPPPRPNNPPASPKKALFSSEDSLSSSPEMITSTTLLSSPSSYDHDSSSSEDPSSPPPLPVSMPPVKSRPRALPEHFIPLMPSESTHPYKSSESDCNTAKTYTMEVESKEYRGEGSVSEAIEDIQLLISELQACIQTKDSSPSLTQFKVSKESLISEVRQFTSNIKILVSSAGQSEEQIARSINVSMHTLARLSSNSQQMMRVMMSVMQATNLGNKTKEVAGNFSNVLSAASMAHGKSLQDPSMQFLLRQAQTMATILSALMRTLRMLQS